MCVLRLGGGVSGLGVGGKEDWTSRFFKTIVSLVVIEPGNWALVFLSL